MEKKANRQSNMEMLRIISMIMIISSHLVVHSNLAFATNEITINRLWTQFISVGGKIGFNLFVMISGYFLIDAEKVKIAKVINIILQTTFYSAGIYFLLIILGQHEFQIVPAIKSIFPLPFSIWGFTSAYFILYLLFPYINLAIGHMPKRQHLCMILMMFVLWSFIPTLTSISFQCGYVLWMIFLYSIGAYIKFYFVANNYKKTRLLVLSILSVFMLFLSAVVFDLLGTKIPEIGIHAGYFYGSYRFPGLIAAVLIFLYFCSVQSGVKPVINLIASMTFGIYLIHDNPYFREYLWKGIVRLETLKDSRLLIPYSLIVIICVFIICGIIEAVRLYVIERAYSNWVIKISKKMNNAIDHHINKLLLDNHFAKK